VLAKTYLSNTVVRAVKKVQPLSKMDRVKKILKYKVAAKKWLWW